MGFELGGNLCRIYQKTWVVQRFLVELMKILVLAKDFLLDLSKIIWFSNLFC